MQTERIFSLRYIQVTIEYVLSFIYDLGAFPASNEFSNLVLPTNADIVDCTGVEDYVSNCTIMYGGSHSICNANDAGVICQKSILICTF